MSTTIASLKLRKFNAEPKFSMISPFVVGPRKGRAIGEPGGGARSVELLGRTDGSSAQHRGFIVPACEEQPSRVGVQIYICTATASGFGWTFVAPQANLLDD